MHSHPTNRLINEKSPYLLQHAYNPVDWYPWHEDAFEKAKAEDKPVFLSIGYSTCHWCHVMEQESFEDPEIAEIMNNHFISIKVDREERPDIDQVYMRVVASLTGTGGWPLSVFMTYDKNPFYGGTYFPPVPRWGSPGFKDLLLMIHQNWLSQKDKIFEASESLVNNLRNGIQAVYNDTPQLDEQIFIKAYHQLESHFDRTRGGFGSAPKFPMGHNLSFLLRYWSRSKEDEALGMVRQTLDAMARGGIYDHIAGGFHRYSTDASWHVPHFEKMLYDQAILAKAYLEGYQVFGQEMYVRVAREIFDYVLNFMRDSSGGFYCAEDADSLDPYSQDNDVSDSKREGAFYVWTMDEVSHTLDEDEFKVFSYYYSVKKNGNVKVDPHGDFVGKNILFIDHTLQKTAKQFDKSEEEIFELLRRSRKKIFDKREKRKRPHLDDKIITDWNGLMISSLAFGSQVLQEPKYLEAAESAALFIMEKLYDKNGRVLHRYRDGDSSFPGTLDDYAFFIHGLIDLYLASFKIRYLQEAVRLAETMIENFWDHGTGLTDEKSIGGFYFTARDSEQLILRYKEIYDGAVPSGNSIAVLNLIRLYYLTMNKTWQAKADSFFLAFSDQIMQHPSGYAQMLIAFDFLTGPSHEFVIADHQDSLFANSVRREIFQRFFSSFTVLFRSALPNELDQTLKVNLSLKDKPLIQNGPAVYYCHGATCHEPITDIDSFKRLLEKTITDV